MGTLCETGAAIKQGIEGLQRSGVDHGACLAAGAGRGCFPCSAPYVPRELVPLEKITILDKIESIKPTPFGRIVLLLGSWWRKLSMRMKKQFVMGQPKPPLFGPEEVRFLAAEEEALGKLPGGKYNENAEKAKREARARVQREIDQEKAAG